MNVLKKFLLLQVGKNLTGFYELVLYSNGFGETKIPFQVIVVDHLPTAKPSSPTSFNEHKSKAYIIWISTGVGLLIVFTGLVVLIYLRWKKKKGAPGKI